MMCDGPDCGVGTCIRNSNALLGSDHVRINKVMFRGVGLMKKCTYVYTNMSEDK